jgi:hypothetical protein
MTHATLNLDGSAWRVRQAGTARTLMAAVPGCVHKDLNLRDPRLSVATVATADGGRRCRLAVQRPALWVWAGAPEGQSWSDNFFPLRPGAEREVTLPVPADGVWRSWFEEAQ